VLGRVGLSGAGDGYDACAEKVGPCPPVRKEVGYLRKIHEKTEKRKAGKKKMVSLYPRDIITNYEHTF
jgi:hypothetical protein